MLGLELDRIENGKKATYLLPSPHRTERVEEAHIFEEIRIEPETRGRCENRDDEQNKADDRHGEK